MKNLVLGTVLVGSLFAPNLASASECKFLSKAEFIEYLASANHYQNNWNGWKTRMEFSGLASKAKLSLKRVGPDGRKYKKVTVGVSLEAPDTLKYTNESGDTYWLYLTPRCQLSFFGNNHPIARH